MSYHRGGQAGAVAVSYSTSPMAPHSPSRRCSTGSSSTNGSAIGSSTSKLNSYRSAGSSSILDRPTNFYSSSLGSSGFRSSYTSEYRRSYCPSGSFYSSTATGTSIRRSYVSEYSRSRCSPARSVSSSAYSSTGGSDTSTSATSVTANGTRIGKYGSSSRDRAQESSSSKQLEVSSNPTADIISRYSPSGYIPNIRQTGGNSSTTITTNSLGGSHQWKHHSTGSSLTELFGGDEREVERTRDRPESPFSSSSSSSTAAAGGAHWSRSKRRPGSSSTVLTSGHVRAESAASPGEDKVTQPVEDVEIEDATAEVIRGIDGPATIEAIAFLRGGRTENPEILEDGEEEERNASTSYDIDQSGFGGGGTPPVLQNGVAGRPSGTYGDDPSVPSTSRRSDGHFSGNTNATSNLTSSSPTAPSTAHQSLYRGVADQFEGSPTNKSARNRLQAHRDERCGLNGLRNIGNTCFMNSVIQCLSNTRPLLEYLLNEQYLADINTTTSSMKGALIKAFSQVIHELWEVGGDHVVNTTALKSQIQRFAPRFMGYSQQDAQEFLRYLLEGLHEDVNRVTVKPQPIHTDIPEMYTDSQKAVESWKRYLRSEDSMIVDVFVGQLRSSLHCTACDHVSVTLDPFWDLSLPIPARSGTVKLSQCLEHFTREEVLDGDEKPTCSKCQMRRKCTKSFSIQKFPKILVIHLKRFSPMERFRGKLNVMVDFPLTGLDLSAFAAPRVPGCTYNLYGVANHSGTTYSGHYTAYCKHPYSGEWHEYNDSRVSVVPARSVVSSEAYVLFYEQQPHSSHL
ncbi:uncharacterized protein LOC143181237 isoform X3 [Calliopsis andreniformis]|uniref:uncharacterized protein LOC143181237 isoform X3 n=1 Tax=Calliopsis andreniformis TaxID=337506 RepID=UPI003FCDDF61